jgi:hypothetical protein
MRSLLSVPALTLYPGSAEVPVNESVGPATSIAAALAAEGVEVQYVVNNAGCIGCSCRHLDPSGKNHLHQA